MTKCKDCPYNCGGYADCGEEYEESDKEESNNMVIIGIQQGGDKVISWWWLIPAAIAGMLFGIFAIALVSAGRDE